MVLTALIQTTLDGAAQKWFSVLPIEIKSDWRRFTQDKYKRLPTKSNRYTESTTNAYTKLNEYTIFSTYTITKPNNNAFLPTNSNAK